MQAVRQWMFVFVLAAAMFGPGPFGAFTAHSAAAVTASSIKAAPELQTATRLALTGPTSCPSTGCVGGQRLGMRFDYDLPSALIDPGTAQTPNVRVCIYAPAFWDIVPGNVDIDKKGRVSNASYTAAPADNFCEGNNQIRGYKLISDLVAPIPTNAPTSDALEFSFRLGSIVLPSDGSQPVEGIVTGRLYPATAPNSWAASPTAAASSTPPIRVVPLTGASAYVGSDSDTCGDSSNCYVNSAGDGANGLGTGLKDAIDVPAISTINILGNYPIKTQTVRVSRKLTLTGSNGATITYHGSSDAKSCGNFMLSFGATVTLRGLYINGGDCTTTRRNLIEINSPTAKPTGDVVLIESNDLSSGANAVTIRSGTTDYVVVRYNQISKNTGFGVFAENGPAPLEVVANNFISNGSTPITANGPTIQCAAGAAALASHRKANHNYWNGVTPDPNAAHCVYDPAKRLGSPIAHKTDEAGVRAAMVAVTKDKTTAAQFENLISYNYSGSGGSPFNLYIVDYGYMPLIPYNEQEANDAPFSFWGGGSSPSPCSNYWDVFLPDGVQISNTLELYFKYFNKDNMTPSCVAAINSVLYCAQTASPDKYPLFWLDPSTTSVTNWWNQVGASPANQTNVEGQITTCHTDTQEIQVSLSSKRRPALSDLGYTPFVIGIPVIKSFSLVTTNQTVTINWSTYNEADVVGFNILRGTTSTNLTPLYVTNLSHYGSASAGYASYVNTNSSLTNGTLYYYRLKVIRADGNAIYSNIESITVNVITPIPPTLTRTATPIRPTNTPPFTPVPTRLPTQPFKSPTPQPTFTEAPTPFTLPTLTDTAEPETSGAAATLTAVAVASASTVTPTETSEALGSGTPEHTLSAVPPEAVAGAATTGQHPWLSLLLGLLAGLGLSAGIGGLWYRTTRK